MVIDADGWSLGRWYAYGALDGAVFMQDTRVSSGAPAREPAGGVWAWVIIADAEQFDTLVGMSQSAICDTDMTTLMFAAAQVGWPVGNETDVTPVWNVTAPVPDASYYSFLFVSCTPASLQLTIDYHLVNPGGEELSAGYVPLKAMTAGMLATWGGVGSAMIVAMALATALWRNVYAAATAPALMVGPDGTAVMVSAPAPVRALHVALLVVPALFAANAAVARAYVLRASTAGTWDFSLQVAAVMAADVSTSALLAISMLVSRGWQITRFHVEPAEQRQVAIIVSLYFIVYAVWDLFPGFFFLFLLILAYVLMLRYIFAAVTWRLRLLHGFRAYAAALFARSGAHAIAADAMSGDPAAHPPPTYADNTVYIASPPAARLAPASAPPAPTVAADAGDGDPGSLPPPAPPTAAAVALVDVPVGDAGALPPMHAPDALTAARAASAAAAAQTAAPPRRGFWGAVARANTAVFGDPRTIRDGTLTTRQIAALRTFRAVIVAYLTMTSMVRVISRWWLVWCILLAHSHPPSPRPPPAQVQVWTVLVVNDAPWIAYLASELFDLLLVAFLCSSDRAATPPIACCTILPATPPASRSTCCPAWVALTLSTAAAAAATATAALATTRLQVSRRVARRAAAAAVAAPRRASL